MSLAPHPFFSCAYYRPDLSLYTHTHAYSRFRWPRFVTSPSSLGSFSPATTHTFVCLVLLIFICPFCVHMCLPPFRAGWRSHMPPFGEACVCNPWNHRDPFGFFWFAFLFYFTAGGTGGAVETGANKDTHQSPVIQLETSNCVPANFPTFCMA